MALCQEAKEYDATRPDIHSTRLTGEIKKSFGWHVTLSACSILDLHVLLQLHNFLHVLVVSHCGIFRGKVCVYFDLRQPKVNQEAGARLWIVQKIGRLDVTMHNT